MPAQGNLILDNEFQDDVYGILTAGDATVKAWHDAFVRVTPRRTGVPTF